MKKLFIISAMALLFANVNIYASNNIYSNSIGISADCVYLNVNKPITIKLKISGMTCSGCANHVSGALDKHEGVLEHELKYPGEIVIITYDPNKTDEEKIIKTIEDAGYTVSKLTEEENKKSKS